MNKKVRFGVLSTAKIGIDYVIPAMQQGLNCEVAAISSRNAEKAKVVAGELGLPGHFGSYEAMLEDPEIDAVYNPLPNHLHVPWTIKALEAGKHVLCEKPIAMNAGEAQSLLETSRNYPELKVMEAFMYRFHPRWQRIRELIAEGVIGELKAVHSYFAYFNDDPGDIRNKADMGGGGLMDIGCYSISCARFLFGREPIHATGILDMEPGFGVDRLASGLLDFGGGTSVFTCTMRSPGYQYLKAFGTNGYIMMDQPYNPPFDRSTDMTVVSGDNTRELSFDPCNHFTLQGDAFARSILEDTPVPTPLEDAVANMKVLEGVGSRE